MNFELEKRELQLIRLWGKMYVQHPMLMHFFEEDLDDSERLLKRIEGML